MIRRRRPVRAYYNAEQLRARVCRECRVELGSRSHCPLCGAETELVELEAVSPFQSVERKGGDQ